MGANDGGIRNIWGTGAVGCVLRTKTEALHSTDIIDKPIPLK